ncbi:hypothetical protein Y032_0005g2294 [Ancylostoma ceylanicum]|uniref:Uncharacterized protein n=1 Tax=Ancylostoma ceylanicum TaxID=53326 RepID=A0A016VS16_9BILA|nr:hypothetical protein Y032_0005g2294 [Ancylostoma ceylanicum]
MNVKGRILENSNENEQILTSNTRRNPNLIRKRTTLEGNVENFPQAHVICQAVRRCFLMTPSENHPWTPGMSGSREVVDGLPRGHQTRLMFLQRLRLNS